MLLEFRLVNLVKKRPLQISRGSSSGSQNLFLWVRHAGISGLGEMAPIGYSGGQTAECAQSELLGVAAALEGVEPWQISQIELISSGLSSGARCALVNACYDWAGKKLAVPVHELLGLEPAQARTSITAGINPAERVRELVPELLRETGTDELKLKLGNPEGIKADKDSFMAAVESAPGGTKIRVDANGGWSVSDAIEMIAWLAERGCGYVEQPLGFENEDGLADLMKMRRIPIFLDEFICTAADVARFAGVCDGINLKLMKSGGIAEGLRVVNTARAHGLKTMIGCFSESSISISAGAAIGSLFDYIDLDSHLNLAPDPAVGCAIENGRLVPCDSPGFGAQLR